MGCASSKRIDVTTVDLYRPPPSSFAVFDINAIEEPWLKDIDAQQLHDEKPTHVPALLLEKLNAIEDAPRTWDEVSKALEDLKPTLNNPKPSPPINPSPPKALPPAQVSKAPRKSFSFHTLEELDAKLSSKPTELKKTESMHIELKKTDSAKSMHIELKKTYSGKPQLKKFESTKSESRAGLVPGTESRPGLASETVSEGYKPVRENMFILRDRLERQKEGKATPFVKRDPLSDYPEKCPPGGADSVVIYTTSLGGVRRTYEDCNKLRTILEFHRVVFDERDLSLHGEFINELKVLLGEEASVPRMFVKGKYVGGLEEVVNLNETGRLGRILSWARVERGWGRLGCEGCGGARFVPCLDCGGSCKITVGDTKERCPECNENGLVHCPACA